MQPQDLWFDLTDLKLWILVAVPSNRCQLCHLFSMSVKIKTMFKITFSSFLLKLQNSAFNHGDKLVLVFSEVLRRPRCHAIATCGGYQLHVFATTRQQS